MDNATVYSTSSYRIRVGTWNESDMDASYEVVKFAAQTDQLTFNLPWYAPVDPSGAWNEVVEIVDALDESSGGFGGLNGDWILPVMTPGMTQYIRSAIFAGGFSARVTIVSWDRQAGWRVIQCMAHWNEPAKSAEPRGVRGYQRLRISFTGGVIASPGWSFSNGFSNGFFAEG